MAGSVEAHEKRDEGRSNPPLLARLCDVMDALRDAHDLAVQHGDVGIAADIWGLVADTAMVVDKKIDRRSNA